jgi:hypothetical protein
MEERSALIRFQAGILCVRDLLHLGPSSNQQPPLEYVFSWVSAQLIKLYMQVANACEAKAVFGAILVASAFRVESLEDLKAESTML